MRDCSLRLGAGIAGRSQPEQHESAPVHRVNGPLGGLMDIEQGYDLLRSADAHTSHLPSGVAGPGRFGSLGRLRLDSAKIAQKAPHRLGKSDVNGNDALINVL